MRSRLLLTVAFVLLFVAGIALGGDVVFGPDGLSVEVTFEPGDFSFCLPEPSSPAPFATAPAPLAPSPHASPSPDSPTARPFDGPRAEPPEAPDPAAPRHKPVVTLGKPVVRGGLSRELVRRIVRRHRAELVRCHETALRRNPEASGRVVYELTITPSGQVVLVIPRESTTRDRELDACAGSALLRWLFPKPRGGDLVHVTQPVLFTTKPAR